MGALLWLHVTYHVAAAPASALVLGAGYRVNVIPPEARATLDVRLHPRDDPDMFLEQLRKVINDPSVEVTFLTRDVRPGTGGRLTERQVVILEFTAPCGASEPPGRTRETAEWPSAGCRVRL